MVPMNVPMPANEAERLKALRRYEILDTPPDGTFDHITSLTARLFGVPIAIVSLVDHDRIWFKSHHGLDVNQINRDPGLCASAILSPEVYHIRDAIRDPRALTNPLVAGEFGLRFYAASPLATHDGYNLGTLCIIDKQPRELTDDEKAMLADLAAVVMDQMELRLASRKLAEVEDQLREMNDALEHRVQERTAELAQTNDMLRVEVAERQRAESALRTITEETAAVTGSDFFHLLVQHLARVFQVQYAFVTECADETTRNLRILAFWTGDGFADSITYNVHGTPCENVVSGQICSYPERLQSLFPLEKELVTLNAEGYLGAPLYDRDGHIVGHLAVIDTKPLYPKPYDISILKIFAARAAAELKRKRAEEALMASEKRFRALFESAPIGVSINNPQGTFVQVNKSLQEMIGFTEEELQQVNFGAITHAEDIAQSKQLFVEMVQGERKGFQVEKRYVKKNGDVMWASTNCAAIWDEGGIFVYTFAMVEDITKRKQAEQALREAMAKVEELKNRLQAENVYLQEEIRTHHNFEEIIGSSPAMRKVFQSVEKVAVTDTTVLITGETGTGKELVARAIHNLSPRKDRPLITVNCAALPAGLIESELFGHEKGAFTGAVARKKGRFELADGGTLFLDEVGELPLETQAKLLRVLQEHSFERVGGTQPLKVNVRVLAATNRDLQEQVNHGAFRADLFYRLNIFPIPLPSLRERGEDISLLTNYFVARFARRMGKKIDRVSHGALERLMRYPWPGNIRELANLIERAVILCDGGMLQPDHLGLTEHIPTAVASEIAQVATLQETERDHILKTLEKTNWIVGGPAGAAQLLGLNRTTLLARMKKLGIEKPTAR